MSFTFQTETKHSNGTRKNSDSKSGQIWSFKGGRWIEVAPKNSVTTLSLVVPSGEGMSEEWYNWARDRIGKETGIWFYTDNIQTSYDELKGKSVEISEPEKQAWGGIMSTVKDQDGNKFALISSPES